MALIVTSAGRSETDERESFAADVENLGFEMHTQVFASRIFLPANLRAFAPLHNFLNSLHDAVSFFDACAVPRTAHAFSHFCSERFLPM